MKIQIKNFIILLLLIPFGYCKTPTIYRNFNDYKPQEEIAILEFDGYVLRLKDESNPEYYDKLYLLEGEYLIEFKDRINFTKGAALCNLKANKKYTIKITGKKEFPQYKKYVYIGDCIEVPEKEQGFLEKFLLEKKLEEKIKNEY
ncbi:MAG: hypothetical protein KatS3mg129_0626 [Leptospiraceae bacterium]|nr:MAG: hypothetical protein KatS3mg129_0626 [Leptospiraceae bacterium]